MRCNGGWLWNPYTKLCVKYVTSVEALAGYKGAADDCGSQGGSLFTMNSTEKRFLLFEIMNSSKYRHSTSLWKQVSYIDSVWVGESYMIISITYLVGSDCSAVLYLHY